jgi:hypothetical protein
MMCCYYVLIGSEKTRLGSKYSKHGYYAFSRSGFGDFDVSTEASFLGDIFVSSSRTSRDPWRAYSSSEKH